MGRRLAMKLLISGTILVLGLWWVAAWVAVEVGLRMLGGGERR